jgi:Mor family transcriptional regulator
MANKTKLDWNKKRAELEALINQGYSYHRLARHFKMSVSGIQQVLIRMGLQTQRSVRYDEERASPALEA